LHSLPIPLPLPFKCKHSRFLLRLRAENACAHLAQKSIDGRFVFFVKLPGGHGHGILRLLALFSCQWVGFREQYTYFKDRIVSATL
jgi:hypothetical protein